MNSTRCTGTFFFGMVIIATRAGVHRRNQHKAGRKVNGYFGPADGYSPLFHWLTHYFKYTTFKLRQFIKEQYAIMRQGNFTGLGNATSTHKRYITNSMMGGTEWPLGNQGGMGR